MDNTHSFKVGDLVKCIDDSNSDDKLRIGNIYEVRKVDYTHLQLKDNHFEWYVDRFELAEDVILKEIWSTPLDNT